MIEVRKLQEALCFGPARDVEKKLVELGEMVQKLEDDHRAMRKALEDCASKSPIIKNIARDALEKLKIK